MGAIAHSAHGLKHCVGERMHMVADEEISAEKVAAPAQTAPHEVTTLLQALLLRVYPQRGRVVELKAALAE